MIKLNRAFKLFIITSLCIITLAVNGQERNLQNSLVKKNAVDFTLGGQGILGSLNYYRVLTVQPGYFVNFSVGAGTAYMVGGTTFPHQLTINFGKKSSFLEMGVGGTFWTGKDTSTGTFDNVSSYVTSPVLGWRKHFDNNFTLRIYANPLMNSLEEIIPFGGISFGYRF